MIDNVLSVRNLSIGFQENLTTNTVLFDSNFDLQRGSTLSLVGESGSGKSITSLSIV